MNQECKDLLQAIFHDKEQPDYYSYRYEISKETENKIMLHLDDDLLEKPIGSLLSNLMEWGLHITCLVIGCNPKDYDDEMLCMEITETPCEGQR